MRSEGRAFQAPQTFSASFVLRGTPSAGELSLGTPLGTTLAKAQWAPGLASLTQSGETRTYASIDELTAALAGEPLPLTALFGWLQGQANTVDGWEPDLTQWAQGRIRATRRVDTSHTDIRVVLDQPDN
ncbi:MAG: hypothetical protein K2W33_16995 [Burkholderiales bacterium]|nr:hypothetical protein [Burkholderiales bacterium]